MLRRRCGLWFVAFAGLWTGCAFGPFASSTATPPVELPAGGLTVAPTPLTADEVRMLWGHLDAESPALADQAAGIEGVPTGWGWCPNCSEAEGLVKLDANGNCRCVGGSGGGRGAPGNYTPAQWLALISISALIVGWTLGGW